MTTLLAGKRIMVLEDEAIIAMMMEDMLDELGARIVGPATTIAAALALVESADFDAAILDIHVAGQSSESVALALAARKIPFLFATGYGAHPLPSFDQVALLQKPYRIDTLRRALEVLCASDPQRWASG